MLSNQPGIAARNAVQKCKRKGTGTYFDILSGLLGIMFFRQIYHEFEKAVRRYAVEQIMSLVAEQTDTGREPTETRLASDSRRTVHSSGREVLASSPPATFLHL